MYDFLIKFSYKNKYNIYPYKNILSIKKSNYEINI